jgi:UDP:flavonoid glycosyltransferase YjiC (YdhE family)
MRVLLAPFGSRGDVEPLVALGLGLVARAHDVEVVAPEDFAQFVGDHGLAYRRAGPPFKDAFDGTQSELFPLRMAMRAVGEQFSALESACAAARPDVIVSSMMQFAGPSVAQRNAIPHFYTVFCSNYLQSRAHAFVGLPFRKAPYWFQRAVWAGQDLLTPPFARPLNALRAVRGLPPVKSLYRHLMQSGPLFVAADPAIAPLPADGVANAGTAVHETGAWRLPPPAGRLDASLERFLEAGPAPVYVGFGSMVHRDVRGLSRLVRRAVEDAGVRAVLGSGWSGLGATERPRDSIVIGEIAHDLLFPRMAAIVHHGGAGTTTSAALAGRPQVIISHIADQYFHGYRMAELGVAPQPLRLFGLRAGSLARAMRAVVNEPHFAERANALAGRMTREGVTNAVAVLEAEVIRKST